MMANHNIININKTKIECLFERKPRLTENFSRLQIEGIGLDPSWSNETDYPQISNRSLIKYDHTIFKSTEGYNKDNNIFIYVSKKKRSNHRKRREFNVYQYSKNEITFLINSKTKSRLPKHYSLLEFPNSNYKNEYLKQVQSSNSICTNTHKPYNRNFIVNNCCRSCDKPECGNPFKNPSVIAKIYRCQMAAEDTCCCSCNSDAMFEVMKSLYDCYKKKNCENCTCILCGTGKRKKSVGVGEEEIVSLEGKSKEEKEQILREIAMNNKPFPEVKTPSDKALVDKVRRELGLPPEPKNSAERNMYKNAYKKGIIEPLEGKSNKEKEKILKRMLHAGIPLPEGRTPSEVKLINDLKAAGPSLTEIRSEKLRKAQDEGLLTPLDGKTPEQQEKIIKGRAKLGIPLPEGKTPSQNKLIEKIRNEMGLPPEPKSSTERAKLRKAYAEGIVTPLEGKTSAQKEAALTKMAEAGIPLPEGRTPSEKVLIDKIRATVKKKPSGVPSGVPSEKIRKAKAEGFITPLAGKTPEQKEKIVKGLAKHGIPLPEGKTASEQKLIAKVRQEVGLPPEPKTSAEKRRLKQAYANGIITPLEGKTPEQKEAALTKMAEAGVPLPEGRTPSEKVLIDKIRATVKKKPSGKPSGVPSGVPSEKMRKAKAEGFITPLAGKTPEQKEKILKGLAVNGIPLPEGKTSSEKAIIDKIRKDMGLPSAPKNSAEKQLLQKAYADGIITPLEGKTPAQKEAALKKMAEAGIPLPEGRTPSEKALIDKVKATVPQIPSEKLRKAKAEGLITPLAGKTPEQKEQILKGLAKHGIPLPEGKTASEKKLIDQVRQEMGLPPEPKTSKEKRKLRQAYADGIVTPLEGKTPAQKEQALRKMAEAGIPLPEGRTPSEKALINKVQATTVKRPSGVPSAKYRKAQAEGLITPLEGKTPEQKEKIIKGLAVNGIPLPEGKTSSEKAIIDKIRKDMGLPPAPKNSAEKQLLQKAYADGIITPLEGKTPAQKEAALKKMAEAGIPLPEGRTPSEKALINKVKAIVPQIPSEKLRKAKAEGLITPLAGKTPEQKEQILKGLAKLGLPLPEGKTASEKKLIDQVRQEMGLPPEPKTSKEKRKLRQAYANGIVTPLEGKTPAQKEQALRKMAEAGIPLPEGRTPSEKALINKVQATTVKRPSGVPSAKYRKAQAEGLITPLEGKTPEQKEKIIKGLAVNGIPLPEGKTSSEKAIIDKIRKDMGLPPAPKNSAEKQLLQKAYADGIITPLEGKTPAQKEAALKKMAEAGIPLPEGRTPSEKALIDKVKATVPQIPSEKLRKAKAEGLITPLAGKTPEQKEQILKGLAKHGLPLPEGKTASEKKLIDQVRQEMGLPPEPKTSEEKRKLRQAYADGIVTPLEGKTPAQKEQALRKMAEAGIPLPEGRTPSEKALINKVQATTVKRPSGVPSAKYRKAQAEGLITPLEGKTPDQKEKILKGLAVNGIPLPEGKTASEKKLIDQVRQEMGLPPEPKTSKEKRKLRQAYADGIVTPLEGKTPAQKELALRKMAEAGIPLPEGRTPSEKAIIDNVKATTVRKPSEIPSAKIKKARAEGFITPLAGKSPEQKERILKGLANNGIPLPEGKTPSEKALIDKVRKELGLPPEPKNSADRAKMKHAYAQGLITPLEGKTPSQKENVLRKMKEAGLPLPEGRTPSEQALVNKIRAERPKIAPSEKLRKAKEAGLLTPLEGKTPQQKEEIIKGLAELGLPLPEGKTSSEKALIDKVRKDMGLPPEPKTPSEKVRMAKLYAKGLITPMEGKTPEQKEAALKRMAEAGIALPEGRTPSEKALIAKVKAETKPLVSEVPTERFKKAQEAGFITPLEGKTPEQKEKILKGLAQHGIPLPEGKTPSEKQLINKVRQEMGLPPEPKSSAERKKIKQAYANGIITPLEGKTPEQKEQALRKMAEAGIPLPEGRTPSEKALIDKVKATTEVKPSGIPLGIPSEKIRKAKAEGFITPLEGKTPEQKEKILKGLARYGIPLPEGKTTSEQKLIAKVRQEVGLPPEPKTSAEKRRLKQAYANGIITPLEGKTPEQKEAALTKMAEAGVPLPEGRTPSEKALIDKIRATVKKKPSGKPSGVPSGVPSEKIRKAKAEGFITPLAGKTPEQKEKILKGLAVNGIPLPEGKTSSEKALIDKIRKDMGLPSAPKNSAEKQLLKQAYADGIITPLEGKTPAQKEAALKKMAEAGIPLPEGRTPSEKALIDKIKATVPQIPSEKLRKAKAEGLITPLAGKTPEQKEKILKGLAKHGIPLPVGQSPSEQKLIDKVRQEMGLPSEPKTSSEKKRLKQAYVDGIVTPLEGKTPEQKEAALTKMAEAGIPLPEGRTPSEKAIIDKIRATVKKKPSRKPSGVPSGVPSEKLRKAKAEGFITPLAGKTPEQKEKILKGLAKYGIPLPEGKTPSEQKLIDKVKHEMGLPPEPKTSAEKRRLKQAYANGIVTPLEGKTPEQKEAALRKMAEAGVPLPEGRTPSEKALVDKVKATVVRKPIGIPSEKFAKAKAAGLITPLEGKTPEQKKKILQGLATHGIPFPEGKTPSEKKIIDEVRKEMGLPPLPKTASEKAYMDRAYADGIITPLEGKTPEQKEKALEKMLEAGITLPVGRTDSEKALIEKVKAKGPKPSEIKRRLKERGIGVKPLGIEAQSLEEIVKTTKCDQACGCDRKKIRFKHSYVKIRVTSPDISSFCDCPGECFPGVKSGVFVDNEGIKVTIGFSSMPSGFQSNDGSFSKNTMDSYPNQKFMSFCSAALGSDASVMKKSTDFSCKHKNDEFSYISKEDITNKEETIAMHYDHSSHVFNLPKEVEDNTFTDLSSISMISSKISKQTNFTDDSQLDRSSYDSIVLLGTESSLSLSVGSHATELATISVISFDSSTISVPLYRNVSANRELGLHFAESIKKNGICSSNYSQASIDTYFDDMENCFYKNDQVTILRFTRTKKSKRNDKTKEKKVLISEPDSENIMKIVAEEILNQTHKSDSSSVFVVVQSEDDTNTDVSSVPSQATKLNNQKHKLRESYPVVASEHQLLVASRGVKLISTPRDMKELVPIKQKKAKSKRSNGQDNFSRRACIRANSKSENELDFEETEINRNETKNEIKKSDQVIKSPRKNFENRPYFEGTQVCTYHKNKNAQKMEKQRGAVISLEPKQQSLGFDLNVQSGASRTPQLKPCYLKLNKPTNVHRVIETTKSLTSMCQKGTEIDIENHQKSTEIVPENKPKGLDTSCDRPCTCACESEVCSISSPVLSEMYNKGLAELSADTFIRNSIPYLYQARQYVSPYSSPSDTEPCKCCLKLNPTNMSHHTATYEYNKPTSELWIDYGEEQHQKVISKYASPSDLLPCVCCPRIKQPVDQHKNERIPCSLNAERQSINSNYSEQKQNLKLIQQSLHNRFSDRVKNSKQMGVNPPMTYHSSPKKDLQQALATSYKAEYAKRYPEYLQTNNRYMTPLFMNESPDDTISIAANHLRTCPTCSENYKIQSPMDNKVPVGQFSQSLPYSDFLGQCPEFSNIVKKQFLPRMELFPSNANNVTYANYSMKDLVVSNKNNEFNTHTNNNKRSHQTNSAAYSNYSVQCPECPNIVQNKYIRINDCEQGINNGLATNEDGSIYGELRTVHLSQAIIYGRPREVPLEPPPTRRNTKEESCGDDSRSCQNKDDYNKNQQKQNTDSSINKSDKKQERDESQDYKMCNDCCVRGKIIDCVTPGRTCDPCDRYGQVLPQGFKISNTSHSKLHLRDMLIYEDSSHKCCCITDDDSTISATAEGEANFCEHYCSGDTVETIRDAVERFIKARDQGLICKSESLTSQNICDETRELCHGIEEAIAERERAIADENCQCPQTGSKLQEKHSKVTCGCPKQQCSNEENCKCPSPLWEPNDQKECKKCQKPVTTLAPLVDIHHIGLRELSRRAKSSEPEPKDDCECRFPNGKAPLEECVCPQDKHCECPDVTDEQWFQYFTKGMKMTRREAMMLQTELTQTTSGFVFMKRRKFCNEINTYEEALEFYNEHEGLEKVDGQIKANPDGTCPGCGDFKCPGLWVRNYFDPKSFDPEKLVQENVSRYAKETDKECMFSKCKDSTCPGMGPYGLLPPIPGGPVADIKVKDPAEKDGYHKACTCESMEDFEKDVYCEPEGPIYCECAKGGNVTCECPQDEGKDKDRKVDFNAEGDKNAGDENASKLKGWDKGPCGPLGGLKVTLPGKGTASKGLQGICCFNAFECYSKTSLRSASSNSSTYVVYL